VNIRILLSAMLLGFTGFAATAQNTISQPPTIWLAPDQRAQPIRLASLDVQVRMQGFVARTTLDLVFDNPNDRILEGEFVFPLAAGQSVAGYALEVNGAMREGVVVDKQTARVAFEETTRRQIDPGLAELTAGNVFRTRLYPIPARGSKRVRLHIESTLADLGTAWRYSLPMNFTDSVGHLHVRAEAVLGTATPEVDALAGDPALHFEKTGTAWIAELSRDNVRPQKELAFRIPKNGTADVQLVEAADPIDPSWRSIIAMIDTGLPARLATTVKPKRIALFVDASASAADRDRAREAAALQAYLRTLDGSEIVLVAFRNDADAAQRFVVRAGDGRAVLSAISALPLDGGSSYGALDLKGLGAVDQVLIFGDGLSNFGTSEPQLQADNGRTPPVFVLHAAQRADHARLAQIARHGGGQVIDLTAQTAEQAAASLAQQAWRLLSSTVNTGECRDITPSAPSRSGAGITLTARCRGQAELTLRFGSGDGKEVVRKVAVGRSDSATGALADSVHRLWAQSWIDQLNAATRPDDTAITALAKRYGVVTRTTSLLVLDRIEDYVRYRVEPREPELRAEYQRQLAAQPKSIADPGLASRLDSLAQRWKAFRDYHANSYPGIESVLETMAITELQHWGPSPDKLWADGRAQAETLTKGAKTLTARWLREGAAAESRAAWEREAARLVFSIEALGALRMKLPAPVQHGLQFNQVTGARISEGESAASRNGDDRALARESSPAEPVMAAPPAPAAEAVIAADMMDAAAAGPSGGSSSTSRMRAMAKTDGDIGGAEEDKQLESTLTAQIELSGWNPDTPYLAALRSAKDPYAAYLLERETNGRTPAFYLDVADYLRDEAKLARLALRVLSNLAELDTENTALTRVLAYRLGQWDRYELAIPQFELALTQRAEEPQSYRDLALALSRAAQPDAKRAVELLWKVASSEWNGRFPDIEIIALHELNNVLANTPDGAKIDLAKIGIDQRFLDPVAVGLRVVLSWDADNTDIDLWVTDPSGDKAYYSTPNTRTGGHVSRDSTGGYGPEVYSIRRPLPGTYIVSANYFGDRRQSLTGPVTVQLEFQTRFGSVGGKRAAVTRRLEGGSQTIEIGRFKVGL
jgi:Ca-activated chloride channel homolog